MVITRNLFAEKLEFKKALNAALHEPGRSFHRGKCIHKFCRKKFRPFMLGCIFDGDLAPMLRIFDYDIRKYAGT